MENEVKGIGEIKGMSFADMRRAISGEMDFVVSVNKDVDIAFKELEQTELNQIDNELDRRGISQFRKFTPEETQKIEKGDVPTNYISKEYNNTMRVLKLTYAFKYMTLKGEKVQLQDEKGNTVPYIDKNVYVEKLIWGLGEGSISGLFIQYENITANKFLEVQKKN